MFERLRLVHLLAALEPRADTASLGGSPRLRPCCAGRVGPNVTDRVAPKPSQTAQQAISQDVADAEPSGQRPSEVVVRKRRSA
jgi:hypothetical protein